VIESDYRGKRTKLRFGLESSRKKKKKRERERRCVVDLEMEQRESSKREALMEINLH
jgi:hypothetical protein